MESADLDAFDCFLVLDMAIRLARMRDALASEEHEVLFFEPKEAIHVKLHSKWPWLASYRECTVAT